MADEWRGHDKRSLGIALIGAGFMGSTHARAYRALPAVFPQDVMPDLRWVVDVTDEAARRAAQRWDIPRWTSDWNLVLEDEDVDIVDICTPPELHVAIGTAAARAGRHVYCEKPLGRSSAETEALRNAVVENAVASFVGFNYRWAPAAIFAQQLIAEGKLGDIWHFQAVFNSDWAADPSVPGGWRCDKASAGYGALGDVGSHVLDMARFLVGEIDQATGYMRRIIPERPTGPGEQGSREVTNDDEWGALLHFASGATGTAEGSRVATGNKVRFAFEVTGAKGALRWDFQRMNELEVYTPQSDPRLDGFSRVFIGAPHPFHTAFTPQAGIGIGYLETKVLEARAFLNGVSTGVGVGPTFEDGLIVARLLDQIASSRT